MSSNSIVIRLVCASVSILCGLCAASPARADGPALELPGGSGGTEMTTGSYSQGWTFTVNSTIVVSALGFYDAGLNGFAENHPVGIYDPGCNLVASATVTSSDPLIGSFRYHQLDSSVTLYPGLTYIAAGVSGTEPYLYNPSTVTLDPAVVFQKYTIWNFIQQTATLQCPNTPATSQFYGDFGPSFYVGTFPGGQPSDPTKRSTALTVFCNRTGPDLSIAKCTATVADREAPPRLLPTGSVVWEARDAFTPSTASCTPIQVPGSPGIAACDVQFNVPTGFPIGVKFPIDAEYSGDATFSSSATSHKLITPACVSTDPDSPCPNSVGLSFEEYPAILKEKIKTLISCGSTSSASSASANNADSFFPRAEPAGGECKVTGTAGLDVKALFQDIDYETAKRISDDITAADAKKDTMLNYLKHVKDLETAERWKKIQETQMILQIIEKDVTTNRVKASDKPYQKFEEFLRSGGSAGFARAAKKKPAFDKRIASDKIEKVIKADKSAAVTFKLPKRVKTLIAYLKKAGVSTLAVKVDLTVKQKKRKGAAKVSESVSFVLR